MCWVAENRQPFQIINDNALCRLMKTGRPECYMQSAETILCDVNEAYVSVCGR